MKKVAHVIAYVVLFLVMYLVMNAWRAPTPPTQLALSYTDTQGKNTDVIQVSHKRPVLIYFWGSWCGVCQFSSPNVQALHDEGYPVLSVAVSSGDDKALLSYLRQKRYSFATINDTDGSLFDKWQGQATPSFVIVHQGQVKQRFMGVSPLWLLKFRLWLAK